MMWIFGPFPGKTLTTLPTISMPLLVIWRIKCG